MLECFIQYVLVASSLAMIPLSSYLGASSSVLVGFLYVFFGSFQGGTYTSMLALLSRHFATDQDSLVLGFWFGGIDFGNILGFFVCTCFIYYL